MFDDTTIRIPGTDLDGATDPAPSPPATRPLVVAAAAGGAVALSLGIYGRLHTPTGDRIVDFGFTQLLDMKAWLTTGAFVLALVQVASALWMWGRLPGLGPAPSPVAVAHRWTGTAAFLLTLPVAYHCLWALGFQQTTTRVLAHSLLGCGFYGAITTKLLLLRSRRLPGWALPLAGGVLAATLTGVWFTSSYWYFANF